MTNAVFQWGSEKTILSVHDAELTAYLHEQNSNPASRKIKSKNLCVVCSFKYKKPLKYNHLNVLDLRN